MQQQRVFPTTDSGCHDLVETLRCDGCGLEVSRVRPAMESCTFQEQLGPSQDATNPSADESMSRELAQSHSSQPYKFSF